jgi:hypothetical protein
MSPDQLLERISDLALALPEATREVVNGHGMFSVRTKKFAYFLNNHHGDGILSVCFKPAPGTGETWLAVDDELYYRPAYIGRQGWLGLRLDLDTIDWDQVEQHVTESYRQQAPKRLLARLDDPTSK